MAAMITKHPLPCFSWVSAAPPSADLADLEGRADEVVRVNMNPQRATFDLLTCLDKRDGQRDPRIRTEVNQTMSKLFHYTCLFALIAAGLSGQVVPAPTVETSGMVGLAFGETARLNVLNPGFLPSATPASCSAAVAFVDALGTVLKSTTLTIAPGKSAWFDLRSDSDLDLAPADRREIRATLTIPPVPASASATSAVAGCIYVKTLEVFDNSSLRTLVVLGHFRDVTAPATDAP
jgi:hypothetical protein